MQAANNLRKAVISAMCCLLTAHAAYALTPAPEALAPTPAASQARTLTTQGITAAGFAGTPSGVSTEGQRANSGTLKELAELQRQIVLAEARKRLQAATQLPSAERSLTAQQGGQSVSLIAPPAENVARTSSRATSSATLPAAKSGALATDMQKQADSRALETPKALLVSTLVLGARARADVLVDGRVQTIRQGNALGGWTVSSITPEGVIVERRDVQETQSMVGTTGAERANGSSVGASAPGDATTPSGSNLATIPTVGGQVVRAKLRPATPQEIALATRPAMAAVGSAPPVAQPTSAQGGVPTVFRPGQSGVANSLLDPSPASIPPLPAALRTAP